MVSPKFNSLKQYFLKLVHFQENDQHAWELWDEDDDPAEDGVTLNTGHWTRPFKSPLAILITEETENNPLSRMFQTSVSPKISSSRFTAMKLFIRLSWCTVRTNQRNFYHFSTLARELFCLFWDPSAAWKFHFHFLYFLYIK